MTEENIVKIGDKLCRVVFIDDEYFATEIDEGELHLYSGLFPEEEKLEMDMDALMSQDCGETVNMFVDMLETNNAVHDTSDKMQTLCDDTGVMENQECQVMNEDLSEHYIQNITPSGITEIGEFKSKGRGRPRKYSAVNINEQNIVKRPVGRPSKRRLLEVDEYSLEDNQSLGSRKRLRTSEQELTEYMDEEDNKIGRGRPNKYAASDYEDVRSKDYEYTGYKETVSAKGRGRPRKYSNIIDESSISNNDFQYAKIQNGCDTVYSMESASKRYTEFVNKYALSDISETDYKNMESSRGRGRPRKYSNVMNDTSMSNYSFQSAEILDEGYTQSKNYKYKSDHQNGDSVSKRGRGRPRKYSNIMNESGVTKSLTYKYHGNHNYKMDSTRGREEGSYDECDRSRSVDSCDSLDLSRYYHQELHKNGIWKDDLLKEIALNIFMHS